MKLKFLVLQYFSIIIEIKSQIVRERQRELNVFSNLQCQRGRICVTLNKNEISQLTNNFERDVKIGWCAISQINDKNEVVNDENLIELCFSPATNSCGIEAESGYYDQSEFSLIDPARKYVKYSIMAKIYSLMAENNGNDENDDDQSQSGFANIVTRKEKIYRLPLSCYYQADAITDSISYQYIPMEPKTIDPFKGQSDFDMEFFVSDSTDCDHPLEAQRANLVEELFMCVIATNITDPTINFSFNEVWATPSVDPQNVIRTTYYRGPCTFKDEHDEGGEENEEGGEEGNEAEHDLNEVIKVYYPLGRPEKFVNYNTIFYHVDISVCLKPVLELSWGFLSSNSSLSSSSTPLIEFGQLMS